jgi:hypothetical protein
MAGGDAGNAFPEDSASAARFLFFTPDAYEISHGDNVTALREVNSPRCGAMAGEEW